MPEESPVGEHQSNCEIERVNQTLQGQFRSMKLVLESRYGKPIRLLALRSAPTRGARMFPLSVIHIGIGPTGRNNKRTAVAGSPANPLFCP